MKPTPEHTEDQDPRQAQARHDDFELETGDGLEELREQRAVELVAAVLHRQDISRHIDVLRYSPSWLVGRSIKKLCAMANMGTLAPERQDELRFRAREVVDEYKRGLSQR